MKQDSQIRHSPTRHRRVVLALWLATATFPLLAAEVDCKLRYSMSGWSAFYKRSTGSGTISCDNGQSMKVTIEARGGGLSFGKSTIENGIGEFSGVHDINELIGGYAAAEAHAGAVKSAKAQVVTKGEVSLALSGTGRGWDVGVAFGSFVIKRAGR